MKNVITLFLLAFIISNQISFAQVEITGSTDFGRLFDITYDATEQDKLYAVTLRNHIVVSHDNGETWEILYSLITSEGAVIKGLKLVSDGTGLSFFVHSPNSTINEIRIYDIQSAQIIKTFPLPNQLDYAFVTSYSFYEGSTDILLVDTNFPVGLSHEGKTFYTKDGGQTWSMIYYTNNNDNVFINQVAISPNNPEKLFLARGLGDLGENGGLYVSEDAGNTWVDKLPGVVLEPIAFNPSNHQEIYTGTSISFGASTQNLYKSIDGGNNFTAVPITWTDGILDCINVIRYNKNNPLQIIVLEENEVVITEDGGITWQNIVYPDELPDSYYFGLNATYNPQNQEELFISANYVPLFSNDGGETLTWTKSPYFTSTGNIDLYNDESQKHLYYGVQFGYVHRDLNTNVDIAYDILPLNMVSNSPGQTQYADKITPNRVYTFASSFMGSSLKVSDDNGASKNELLMLYINYFTAVATFPSEPNTILAAFAGFEPHETQLKKIDFTDINNVVVHEITLPNLDIIHEIIIDDTGKITITVGTEVFTSVDQGASWINISHGLEIMATNDVIFDLTINPFNNNIMAIASSKGIFISENGGQNWEQKTNSLVYNVAFSTVNENVIVASTYNSDISQFQIHYSSDYGENWATINNEQLLGIESVSSTYLFEDNLAKVFIGSSDLGLVEYTIDFNIAGSPSLEKNPKVVLYPNPTQNVLNINPINLDISQVAIYDLTGAKLLQTKKTNQIDVSHLPSGNYLVRIKEKNNNMFFKRIIIQ